MTTAQTIEYIQNKERAAYFEAREFNFRHVTELLEMRKMYAIDHLKALPGTSEYNVSEMGIQYCNNSLIKLLSINP